MNKRILKIANRMYKIFKVYAAMAVGGALLAVIIQLILAKPVTFLVAIGSIAFVVIGILFFTQSQSRRRKTGAGFREGIRHSK